MINLIYIYLVLVGAIACASTPTESFYHSHKKDANSGVDRSILSISEGFIEKPYVYDPLGELGDNLPLIRADAFDCVTFVDTVLSLSLAKDVGHFEHIWHKMRYQSQQSSRLERNHFTELHWLDNMQPWLKSCQALPGVKKAVATIDVGAWYGWYCRTFGYSCMSHEKSPSNEVALTYVPSETWMEGRIDARKMLPKVMVVMVVNRANQQLKDKIGTDMLVSHMGFLYQSDQGLRLRHASSIFKKVVDVDFIDYVASRKDSSVLGYALFSIHA